MEPLFLVPLSEVGHSTREIVVLVVPSSLRGIEVRPGTTSRDILENHAGNNAYLLKIYGV